MALKIHDHERTPKLEIIKLNNMHIEHFICVYVWQVLNNSKSSSSLENKTINCTL